MRPRYARLAPLLNRIPLGGWFALILASGICALTALGSLVIDEPGPKWPPRPPMPSSTPEPPDSTGEPSSPDQQDYVDSLDRARRHLSLGKLYVTDARYIDLVKGEPRQFAVDVAGSMPALSRSSPRVLTSNIHVGSQVGVKLHCSGANVKCSALSTERQNVTGPDDLATWAWEVTAKSTGKVTFVVTATSYYRNTDIVLYEKPPITTRAVVVAAPPLTAEMVGSLGSQPPLSG